MKEIANTVFSLQRDYWNAAAVNVHCFQDSCTMHTDPSSIPNPSVGSTLWIVDHRLTIVLCRLEIIWPFKTTVMICLLALFCRLPGSLRRAMLT